MTAAAPAGDVDYALHDSAVRRSQSAWTFLDEAVVERFMGDLSRDLVDENSDRSYGGLRTQSTYDGSLRMVVSHPCRGER